MKIRSIAVSSLLYSSEKIRKFIMPNLSFYINIDTTSNFDISNYIKTNKNNNVLVAGDPYVPKMGTH